MAPNNVADMELLSLFGVNVHFIGPLTPYLLAKILSGMRPEIELSSILVNRNSVFRFHY
jgi:hypothetical protein